MTEAAATAWGAHVHAHVNAYPRTDTHTLAV